MTPASLTRRATDGFCTTFSTGTVQTMPGTFHSTSRFATPPRSRSAGRNTRRALRRPHMRPRLYQLLRCRRRRFTMSVDHASGDASRGYAKWATQVFRAAPPPAVQDWGWPKFAAHTELRARDLSAPTARYAARDCHCQCVVDGYRAQRRRCGLLAARVQAPRTRSAVPACRRRRSAPRRRRWLGTNTVAPRVRARSPRGCRHSGSGNCACARGRRR